MHHLHARCNAKGLPIIPHWLSKQLCLSNTVPAAHFGTLSIAVVPKLVPSTHLAACWRLCSLLHRRQMLVAFVAALWLPFSSLLRICISSCSTGATKTQRPRSSGSQAMEMQLHGVRC